MVSSTHKFLLTFILVSASATAVFAQCQNSRIRPIYNQPMYSQPVYSQPVYSQPIYGQPVYSQPVTVQPIVASSPQPISANEAARMYTADAKKLFLSGEYLSAKQKLDEVVKFAPKDSNAFQFRSLASFAGSNFDDAAADAYDSLGLGNAWTQPVIQSLYGKEAKTYQDHLASLKRVVEIKPTMQSHFLLAYHHLMNEQWNEGRGQLEKVLELQANEPLSTKLLEIVNAKLAENTQASR